MGKETQSRIIWYDGVERKYSEYMLGKYSGSEMEYGVSGGA